MRRVFTACAVLFFLFLTPARPVQAAAQAPAVLLVVLDGTSLADWQEPGLPTLHHLLVSGSVGLMNSITAGGSDDRAAAMTIGASAHLYGAGAASFYGVRERVGGHAAGDVFQRPGSPQLPPGAVVDLGLFASRRADRVLGYSYTIGALGGALAQHGISTAVVGNSDLPGSPDRSAAAIAMLPQGYVPFGDVSPDLRTPDPGAPYGASLDQARLLAATTSALQHAGFVVVDYGDTDRAIASGRSDALHASLVRADAFLGALLPQLPEGTLLLVASPSPAPSMARRDATLMPLLVDGRGFGPGYLTSATTHRRGIVTNLDIAPTVLSAFGVPSPATAFGQPLSFLPGTNASPSLASVARRSAFETRARPVMLTAIAGYALLVIALSLLVRRGHPLLAPLQTSVLALPLAATLIGALRPTAIWVELLEIGLVTAIATVSVRRLGKGPLDEIAWPAIATALLVTLDVVTGQHLIRHSPLGYDVQIGGRYYGISDAFMGVLVGAAAVGFPALAQRLSPRRWPIQLSLFAFVAMLLVLVFPGLGTKAGAAITATAAFAYALMRLHGRRVGLPQALYVATAAILLLGLLVVADIGLHSAQSRTDIGRAALLIGHGGASQALSIVARKLGTNLRLTVGWLWEVAVMLLALSGILRAVSGSGTLPAVRRAWPRLQAGISAALVGAAVGYVFNDTGVVSATLTLIYPMMALLRADQSPPYAAAVGARD